MSTDYTDKSEKIQSPALAIDGTRARALREAKKLTQLYVASVVGVTTDTISRWENNRYPSIKRENAEKLAQALEVALDDILRQEDETTDDLQPDPTAESSPPVAAPAAPSSRWLWLGLALLLLLSGWGGWHYLLNPPIALTATRTLPAQAAPGAIIPVKIVIERQTADRRGVIVKESLPPGWILEQAIPPTASRGPQQELKWLLPGGVATTTLLYTVQVPVTARAGTAAAFAGNIILQEGGNARATVVGGGSTTQVATFHWADTNADLRIDDTEIMPAYYLTEEFKEFGLDWRTVEAIWNSGRYQWDQKTHAAKPLPP